MLTAEMKLSLARQPEPDGENCAFCGDSGHQAFECHAIYEASLLEALAELLREGLTTGRRCDELAVRVRDLLVHDGWHNHGPHGPTDPVPFAVAGAATAYQIVLAARIRASDCDRQCAARVAALSSSRRRPELCDCGHQGRLQDATRLLVAAGVA